MQDLADVDLVLLNEDYDRSLVLMAKKLGWSLEKVLYLQLRVSEVISENQTCTKLWLPFRVAFAPLFPKGNLPFSGTGKRPVSMGSPTISTESRV